MKRWIMVALVCALSLALATGASAAEIQATGTGYVRTTPDIATLSLGVTETGMEIQVALRSVNERIEAMRQALIAEGVAREDIAVESLYMYTNYDYAGGDGKITGYNISHQTSVTVRDLDKLGALIDAALGAGANQLGGVSFALEDNEEAYERALALAVANATSHAKAMAEAAGLTLGKIEELTETQGNYVYATMAGKGVQYDSAATSVDVGGLTVSANVTISYEAK